MEKQPIDDLFARKLREAEIKPGADVFDRLQSRMNATPLPQAEPKRQLAKWWYAAVAASVLLAVVWISWPAQTKTDTLANRASVKLAPTQPTKPAGESDQPRIQFSQEKETVLAQVNAQRKEQTTRSAQQREKEMPLAVVDKPALTTRSVRVTAAPPTAQPDVPDVQPAREVVANVETNVSAPASKVVDRTVVMTIAEPIQVAAVQPTKADVPAAAAPNLGQLFEKVKQIKSGDVFARATPAPRQAETRSGIKRLVNGVRESLRNENTLEL